MKAVKINDTSYLSWGSSPKLASGSLRLVGVEARPAVVCPPLLLSLQLHCSMSWILSPVWRCHAWVLSMCWFSISCMLSPCTRSSPSCWVMAPKPWDEDVRLMRFGAPPEQELEDRRPGACRVHSSVLALCYDEPPASCWYEWCGYWGGGVGFASLLVLLLVILLGKPEDLCLWPPSRERDG